MNEKEIYRGWWWNPNEIENGKPKEYPGELSIERGGEIKLIIMGYPQFITKNLYDINEQSTIKSICGYGKNISSSKDCAFTLINSLVHHFTTSSLSEITFLVGNICIGAAIEKIDSIKIKQIIVKPKHIQDWIQITGFQHHPAPSEEKFSYNIQYIKPDPIVVFSNSSLKCLVYVSSSLNLIVVNNNRNLYESAKLLIEFKKPIKMVKALNLIDEIHNLFTFMIGAPIPLEETCINLEGDDNKGIFLEIIRKDYNNYTNVKDIREKAMLLPHAFIKVHMPNFIETWFKKYNKNRAALNLYFGKIFNKTQYSENLFLDSVFAIEVLHRSSFPQFNNKTHAYSSKLNSILAKLSLNDKNWIISRIGRKSENTLLNRFEHINEILEPVTRKVFRNPVLDFQRIVTTRNFLVHNEIKDELKGKLIKRDKLDLYSNKLNIIFQGLLLFLYTENIEKIAERIEKPSRNKAAIRYKTI